jgi:hypothetical protein
MAGEQWSREAVAWLAQHPDSTHEQCLDAGFCTDRTYHAFRMKRDDVAKQRLTIRDLNTMQLSTRHDSPEERTAYFAAVEEAAMLRARNQTRTNATEWYAPADGLPVGIVFSGDWHCGAHGVDYPRLDADLDLFHRTPGVYFVGMGDYHEGVSIHSKAAAALYTGCYNDSTEQEERVMMRLWKVRDKTIVDLEGNHDAWLAKHAGLQRMSRLCRELGVEYFGEGGGTVYANVGEQRYVLGVRHNHTGNSQLNTSNAQRRMVDGWLSWDTLHVAVLAHFHFCDLHIASRHSKRCIYLRSGTYKIFDGYAKSRGFYPELGTPLIILLPDREWIIPFRGDDVHHGLNYLAWLREEYRQGRAGNLSEQTLQTSP